MTDSTPAPDRRVLKTKAALRDAMRTAGSRRSVSASARTGRYRRSEPWRPLCASRGDRGSVQRVGPRRFRGQRQRGDQVREQRDRAVAAIVARVAVLERVHARQPQPPVTIAHRAHRLERHGVVEEKVAAAPAGRAHGVVRGFARLHRVPDEPAGGGTGEKHRNFGQADQRKRRTAKGYPTATDSIEIEPPSKPSTGNVTGSTSRHCAST